MWWVWSGSGGCGLACPRRERKVPSSVLYAVSLTRTLYAGQTKARVDNASWCANASQGEKAAQRV